MLALPIMLKSAAENAGMKLPEDIENFEKSEYPHWFVFLEVQCGSPMPHPGAHFDNAKIIANISDERIKTITYDELIDMGLSIGYSK